MHEPIWEYFRIHKIDYKEIDGVCVHTYIWSLHVYILVTVVYSYASGRVGRCVHTRRQGYVPNFLYILAGVYLLYACIPDEKVCQHTRTYLFIPHSSMHTY
jgi:hypothetical protein